MDVQENDAGGGGGGDGGRVGKQRLAVRDETCDHLEHDGHRLKEALEQRDVPRLLGNLDLIWAIPAFTSEERGRRVGGRHGGALRSVWRVWVERARLVESRPIRDAASSGSRCCKRHDGQFRAASVCHVVTFVFGAASLQQPHRTTTSAPAPQVELPPLFDPRCRVRWPVFDAPNSPLARLVDLLVGERCHTRAGTVFVRHLPVRHPRERPPLLGNTPTSRLVVGT